ncbi:hypothetical protein EMIT0P4_30096 [Pseudomonas sp. IT-P4]
MAEPRRDAQRPCPFLVASICHPVRQRRVDPRRCRRGQCQQWRRAAGTGLDQTWLRQQQQTRAPCDAEHEQYAANGTALELCRQPWPDHHPTVIFRRISRPGSPPSSAPFFCFSDQPRYRLLQRYYRDSGCVSAAGKQLSVSIETDKFCIYSAFIQLTTITPNARQSLQLVNGVFYGKQEAKTVCRRRSCQRLCDVGFCGAQGKATFI